MLEYARYVMSITVTKYSRTSMARTLMARLPRLFELDLESLGNYPLAADLENLV